jgi:ribosomal-protein-alanine N-acetyltransferase
MTAPPDPVPFLSSPRLTLEPLRAAHAEAMFEGLADLRLYRFIPAEPPGSVEELVGRYRKLEQRASPDGHETWINWVVRLNSTSSLAGYVQATVANQEQRALIAYVVFAPYWSNGYARESVACGIRWLFQRYPLQEIDALIDTRNVDSIRVVESLGFVCIELIPKADYFKGGWSDDYRYRYAKIA